MPKGTTSPRRLSRARQQPPPPPSHTNSVSSNSSNRAERNTRSNQKASSPQKSSTPQSFTSEDASDEARGGASEPPQLRRSKRQHENDEDGDTKIGDAIDDEIIEDEETTRCICGYQEYPGRPSDPTTSRSVKGAHGANPEEQSDDLGGLFIQCDLCQVWQHGGCVSIMEEAAVPDNYYCEECKPDLHELLKATNGQKFSHYLPVWSKSHPKAIRKGSVEKDDKGKTLKEKERLAKSLPETKRRATMNSRAAYDEDEVLRKVLEESKHEGITGTENGSRKGKRIRDESEDIRSETKRQRTASSVLSSHSGEDSGAESEQDKNSKKPSKQAVSVKGGKGEKTTAEPVGKRRGRRNGGDVVGEQQSSSTTWTCHCGLWTCLCGPSLRDAPVEPPSVTDGPDMESSAAPSARASAKASPTVEADTPDTPILNLHLSNSTAIVNASKRGGKRPGAGRGRSNPAPPTPSERDEKESPRNGNDGGDTPVPSVTINGTSKRGKRGLHKDNESGDSDKDPTSSHAHHHSHLINGIGTAGSDAETAADNGNAVGPHSGTNIPGGKKKEPSMNELKRRAAAMLDWVEKAKEDLGKHSVVAPSMSPVGGSLSPPGLGIVKSELGNVADMLQSRLLGWQVEYGA